MPFDRAGVGHGLHRHVFGFNGAIKRLSMAAHLQVPGQAGSHPHCFSTLFTPLRV